MGDSRTPNSPQMVGLGTNCTHSPQMVDLGINCTHSPQMVDLGTNCTQSPQMVHLGTECTHSPQMVDLGTNGSLRLKKLVTKTKRRKTNGKTNLTTEAQEAFPTEANDKEKAQKKKMQLEGKTIAVVKRKKYVEDHHNECGQNRSRRESVAPRRHRLSRIWQRYQGDIDRYAGTSSRCSQKL